MSPDNKHLVALSGGADSVALLRLLLRLGYKVEAVHCNFQLRGDESQRDERFVRQLCQQLQVPLHLVHFDTHTYATLHKLSIEMAARELRYRYFDQLRADTGADAVCVAHHRNDSVETVLMNLLRGTGIHGMVGIRPRNGHIVRPLLCVSRSELEEYLADLGQDFVTDSTNLVADVVRNKIRLRLIPLLEELTPAAVENISTSAAHLAEAEKLYNAAVEERLADIADGDAIDIRQLLSLPSPESILFELLRRYGFSSEQSTTIFHRLNAPTGRLFSSPTHDLLIDRGRLLIEQHLSPLPPLTIPEPGTYVLGDDRRLHVQITDGIDMSRSPQRATLDADKVTFPLTLRPLVQGDRFIPFGMKGSRLVSDYLTDRKRTLFDKRRQLVLTNANGQIVWLIGERTDNRFRIEPDSRRTLSVSL